MSNNEFVTSIENATLSIINNLRSNMNSACLLIERDAKINCPVDLGILRASMTHEVRVVRTEVIGIVSNSSEYAPYVHQGTGIYAINGDGRRTPWKYKVKIGKYKGFHITKGQKPNPFLEKAREKNKAKILRLLAGGD